jgi:hypothetical protein
MSRRKLYREGLPNTRLYCSKTGVLDLALHPGARASAR